MTGMAEDGDQLVVRGTIVFPPGVRPGRAALVRARVEDVSRADAPARVIAERTWEAVPLPADGDTLPFQLRLPAGAVAGADRTCTVRVHVDVSGTGDVTAGDFVSTASHPVFRAGKPLDVPVRRID